MSCNLPERFSSIYNGTLLNLTIASAAYVLTSDQYRMVRSCVEGQESVLILINTKDRPAELMDALVLVAEYAQNVDVMIMYECSAEVHCTAYLQVLMKFPHMRSRHRTGPILNELLSVLNMNYTTVMILNDDLALLRSLDFRKIAAVQQMFSAMFVGHFTIQTRLDDIIVHRDPPVFRVIANFSIVNERWVLLQIDDCQLYAGWICLYRHVDGVMFPMKMLSEEWPMLRDKGKGSIITRPSELEREWSALRDPLPDYTPSVDRKNTFLFYPAGRQVTANVGMALQSLLADDAATQSDFRLRESEHILRGCFRDPFPYRTSFEVVNRHATHHSIAQPPWMCPDGFP